MTTPETADPAHWDRVYSAREEAALTWFEARPERSLALIRAHARPGEGIIDVGGGASRLVDHLLAEGIGPVTVLDLSAAALAAARDRLGAAADRVDWRTGDVTRFMPDRTWGSGTTARRSTS